MGQVAYFIALGVGAAVLTVLVEIYFIYSGVIERKRLKNGTVVVDLFFVDSLPGWILFVIPPLVGVFTVCATLVPALNLFN